jgi:hypothetical protein
VIAAARRAGLPVPGAGGRMTAEEVRRTLALTRDAEPRVRQAAVMNLCPCHLRRDLPAVWDRVLQMAADPDVGVRKQVFHTLGDGSPGRLEGRVLETLEAMRNDPDRTLRRGARSLLARHRRTGRVNVL